MTKSIKIFILSVCFLLMFSITAFSLTEQKDLTEQKATIVTEQIEIVPVKYNYSVNDIKCLSLNIYHEARNQSVDGQYAVAAVTLNRVKHKEWPSTICEVVWQNRQFSWTQDGKSDNPANKTSWKISKAIALHIIEKSGENYSYDGALFYHADYIKPRWANSMIKIKQIENHIFYKHK